MISNGVNADLHIYYKCNPFIRLKYLRREQLLTDTEPVNSVVNPLGHVVQALLLPGSDL